MSRRNTCLPQYFYFIRHLYVRVAIFEAKYTKVLENLESECDIALQQIDDRMYAKEYEDDYDQILCYGISFFKKRCMVKKKWFTANLNLNSVL